MTKEEWIKVREEPFIPLGVWFSYYKEKGGTIEDPIEFEEQWGDFINLKPTPVMFIRGRLIVVTMETSRKRLYNYYDTMFNTKC